MAVSASTRTRSGASGFWDRVDEIIDRAPSIEALRRHRIHLLAARSWRAQGRVVPAELLADERHAAMAALAVPVLLERIRSTCSGELILAKGPEAAARYPDPLLRPMRDLDLVAEDPSSAQRALLARGFVEVGDREFYARHYHLRPLAWPSFPLAVELHHQPNMPSGTVPPAFAELLSLTVPSATGIASLRAPGPEAHAVLLACHGWAHDPLGRLLDLIDVAVVLASADRTRAAELADRWGCGRVWRATVETVEALLLGPTEPIPLRPWARHLEDGRERAVIENHIARFAGAACGRPRAETLRAAAVALIAEGNRRSGETWGEKLRRTRLAVAHAFKPRSEHERTLNQSRNGGRL